MKSSVQDALKLILAAACVLAAACNGEGLRTEYTYLKALDEDEDVFAYGRIAPDGRRFVYTSERVSAESSSGYVRAVVVYDVDEQRVAFTEPGIDGYWSPDGAGMIYLSQRGEPAVSVLDVRTMTVRRGIAPVALGDYYSWGVDIDGHDVILTITGHYYYLKAGQAELPPRRVIECSPGGPPRRPLLSKDARQLTMFFEGTIVVRNLQDCEGLLYTNMVGAKADFSFDGRYIAFHEQGGTDGESQIRVVDLERRVAIPVTDLRGSCLFPSWTTDGRLFFLCVSDEYRGFVLADQFLSNPAEPLPTDYRNDAWVEEVWINCFEASEPETAITIVLVCSFWSAHCPDALADLQRLSEEIASEGIDARCFAATVPEASDFRRTQALFKRYAPDVQQLELRARGATLTGAQNQIPSTLVFRGNALEERHLGELDYESLRRWAEGRGGER